MDDTALRDPSDAGHHRHLGAPIASARCPVCGREIPAPAPKQQPWPALYAHANREHRPAGNWG